LGWANWVKNTLAMSSNKDQGPLNSDELGEQQLNSAHQRGKGAEIVPHL